MNKILNLAKKFEKQAIIRGEGYSIMGPGTERKDHNLEDWPKDRELEELKKEHNQAITLIGDLMTLLDRIGDYNHYDMAETVLKSMLKHY